MDLVEAKERGFDAGVRHPWEAARLDAVEGLIRHHTRLGSGAVVLDIGCGDTFVAEQLAASRPGVAFYAVDTAFTPELIAHFAARLKGTSVTPLPSLDSVPPLSSPAALVLLMDVIEHIEDDIRFMSELRQRAFVGPGTKVLVTVPAYQSLFCSHDTFLGHFRRYSNRLLREHLHAAGYRVLEIGYFFSSLVPIRILQVLKERRAGAGERPSTGLVEWDGSAAKTAVLHRVLSLDAAVSIGLARRGLRLPGLSNYAICEIATPRPR